MIKRGRAPCNQGRDVSVNECSSAAFAARLGHDRLRSLLSVTSSSRSCPTRHLPRGRLTRRLRQGRHVLKQRPPQLGYELFGFGDTQNHVLDVFYSFLIWAELSARSHSVTVMSHLVFLRGEKGGIGPRCPEADRQPPRNCRAASLKYGLAALCPMGIASSLRSSQ